MNLADDIRKLHELHQAGALTDEEFAKAKATLLNQLQEPEARKTFINEFIRATTTTANAAGIERELLALSDGEFAKVKEAFAMAKANRPQAEIPPQRTDYAEDDGPLPRRIPPQVEKVNNGMALTSFILGLLSVVFYVLGIIPILAVVFGVVGLGTFDNEKHKNPWMPAVGLALGVIYTLVMLNHYGHIK